jgi:hypothetical protein
VFFILPVLTRLHMDASIFRTVEDRDFLNISEFPARLVQPQNSCLYIEFVDVWLRHRKSNMTERPVELSLNSESSPRI